MRRRVLQLTAFAVTLLTYVVIVIGAYVRASGAGLACPDWPTCHGKILPDLGDPLILIEYTHRLAAAFLGVFVALIVILTLWKFREDRPLLWGVLLLVVLFGTQVSLGAVTVLTGLSPIIVAMHLAVATALFGLTVLISFLTYLRGKAVAVPSPTAGEEPEATETATGRLRDYAGLLKPGIMSLLLITTLTTMLIAGGLTVPLPILVFTLAGGALASGSASALNNYLDRDMDGIMVRTRRRAIPSGRIPPEHALAMGVGLSVLAALLLGVWVNVLSAVLALGGIFFYVFVYTLWLKRLTPQNIVIGGAAGGFPALVGWAAATNTVALPAVLIALLIVLWTPPHFWSLAILRREDYARAGVPMLPVVRGEASTRRQILLYSILLVGATVAFYLLGVFSLVFLGLGLALSIPFLALSLLVFLRTEPIYTRALYRYSIPYLALLLLVMVLDRATPIL